MSTCGLPCTAVAPAGAPAEEEEALSTPAGATAAIPAAAVEEAAPAAAASAQMHDCSNDDSGLDLATLAVAASWSSAAARVATDMTMITQMSPGRCANPKP